VVREIVLLGKKRIGFVGFSFKAVPDTLWESPIIEAFEQLIGKGCESRLHDQLVSIVRLTGANKAIPHIALLIVLYIR
jgi:GDP-mannose 6-dehydrogenase